MARGRVYLVEDDNSVRRAMGRLLQATGFEVESFADAAGYLAGPEPQAPACILLDIRMPGMTGFELQSAIAGTPHDLPIVFVTGHGGEDVRARALRSGAVALLFKPVGETELVAAIEKALGERRHPERGSP